MYRVELYQTESGNSPPKKFLEDVLKNQGEKEANTIKQTVQLLSNYGLSMFKEYPRTIKKIRDDIYEFRPGNNRILFFFFMEDHFVLLHGFRKTTNKTPDKEIDVAIKRMKDHKRRYSK